jgi:hypothetical protein
VIDQLKKVVFSVRSSSIKRKERKPGKTLKEIPRGGNRFTRDSRRLNSILFGMFNTTENIN